MDLIVTQAVCEVCAVSFDDVRAVAERLPTQPQVISLDPSTLGEVLADMPRLAEAAGVAEAGERLAEEAGRADRGRPARRGGRAAPARGRARVARPGLHRRPLGAADDRDGGRRGRARHAGREVAHGGVGRGRGGRARGGRGDAVRLLRGAGRGRDDAQRERLAPLGARVVAVDAAAYFSRPGPRLVEGVELLGHLLHPELVPAPPTRRSIELDLGVGAGGPSGSSRPRRPPRAPRRRARARARESASARGSSTSTSADRAADEAADVPAARDVAGRTR